MVYFTLGNWYKPAVQATAIALVTIEELDGKFSC